jgi:hypothetical protein
MSPMPMPINACDGSVMPADPTSALTGRARQLQMLSSLAQATHDMKKAMIQNIRV